MNTIVNLNPARLNLAGLIVLLAMLAGPTQTAATQANPGQPGANNNHSNPQRSDLNSIIDSVDPATANKLRQLAEQQALQRDALETLRATELPDRDAIANVRRQLQHDRTTMRQTIKRSLQNNPALQLKLRKQHAASRLARMLTHVSTDDDCAFELLREHATGPQASIMMANRQQLQSLHQHRNKPRSSAPVREVFQQQRQLITEILLANTSLHKILLELPEASAVS